MKLAQALEDADVAQTYWDGYTVSVVREDEEPTFVISYQVGNMPAHVQNKYNTLEEIEQDIADSFLPVDVEWEPVEEGA